MKDPLDKKERAYDILGVDRDAGKQKIMAAYGVMVRKQGAKAQNAWNKLLKPENRFEEDFWYYPVGDQEKLEISDAGSDKIPLEPEAPAFVSNVDIRYTDLAAERFRKDFRPIQWRKVEFEDLAHYEDDLKELLPIVFDK
jgi:hypothetical protein